MNEELLAQDWQPTLYEKPTFNFNSELKKKEDCGLKSAQVEDDKHFKESLRSKA